MTLFWFVGFTNRIKIISDKTFCFDVWPGPNLWKWHTSHIHRVGCNSEELCGISYVWIPTYVAQETRNDRFVILESILPIASKRRVTHYPRVTKKKKQRCSYKLKQTNKGALTSLKWYIYIYISVLSIWVSCLKLLWVVLVFHLHLYLFWWGFYLGLTLVSRSLSLPLLLHLHV